MDPGRTHRFECNGISFARQVLAEVKEAGEYSLTRIDRREIDCFEKLADTKDFLELPADHQSSLNTHWIRLWRDWIYQEARRKFAEAFDAVEAHRAQGNDPPKAASDERTRNDL